MSSAPRLFTIPPGVAFVDALADGLLDRAAGDPLALGGMTVLLPTRRACRALADAFLRAADGRALILPRLAPLGELDDVAAGPGGDDAPGVGDSFELPPAIADLRRRLLLARRIMALGTQIDERMTVARAARLAEGLAALLDQVQTERLTFERLAGLVDQDYAAHWQITVDFLRLATEDWPRRLAREGCLDPADRRNRLIEAQAARWRVSPPAGPVVAAGSTGSVPATADLIEVVAGLPAGAVVLPGLDTGLDDTAAASIAADHPTHPQHGMMRLLARLGVAPRAVRPWATRIPAAAPPARAALIRYALRPAEEDAAPPPALDAAAALAGVRLVVCPGSHEEAGVIALALRRALETEGRTAALVTPDRTLARRVAAELGRWGVAVDDSAGRPLADTPPGVFLRLAAGMAVEDAAPVPLLALLKHPLAAGGMDPAAFRAGVRALELAVLHGPRPAGGIKGLRRAVAAQVDGAARARLDRWLAGLEAMAELFLALMRRRRASVAALIAAHVDFAERLAAGNEAPGAARLWAGEAGEAAAGFVAELGEAAPGFAMADPADYPALVDALMAGRVVRPRYGLHPRLHIWGPLEARLQHADLVCLGGLNEGTWPADPAADPWMSRPMRRRFGLPPPERRIGLAAHDFAQLFCAREVLITRADRVDGTPTVPSRWILRLANALEAPGGETPAEGPFEARDGDPWLGWQAALDDPGRRPAPVDPPAPRPPVSARPRRLSVTQVETWMRDPYAIYARHVLRLKRLDPLDADPGAADRGTMIHAALDGFIRAYPDTLPGDALAKLLQFGERAFRDAIAHPGVAAFWWPRFERIARWFIEAATDYRATLAETRTEIAGRLVIDGAGEPFVLTAKADRVDRLGAGGLSIIDYKTGTVPSKAEIAAGFAPQLPLEAAIAAAGGFDGVPAGEVQTLEFWRLTGGEPAGERRPAGTDIAALAEAARAGLRDLVARFDDPETPYLSRPDPDHAPRYSDYEHLARVQEWSSPGLDGGTDARDDDGEDGE
jgi:ATP-dependent helicase/nuclease subunit B